MNFKNIFTKAFLFKPEYVPVQLADKILGITAAVFVVAAVALKIAAVKAQLPATKKYLSRFYVLFLTLGLTLGVWYGAAYQQLRFVSYRIFPLLVLLLGLAWFVKIAVSAVKGYSKEKAEYEKEQLKLKYLPK